jgi:SET domain-containing protein
MQHLTVEQINERQDYVKKFNDYLQISKDVMFSSDIIYLSESKIHGIGIFAKQNIEKNELITLYPAHYITISNIPFGMRLTELNIDSKTFLDYSIRYDESIIITGNPLLYKNEKMIGHLCNDGYKHNFINKNKKNIKKYNKKRKEYNNTKFCLIEDTTFMGIISTKNIKKDDEILVDYGFDYWLKRNT